MRKRLTGEQPMRCNTGKPIEECTGSNGCLRHFKCRSCGFFHVRKRCLVKQVEYVSRTVKQKGSMKK